MTERRVVLPDAAYFTSASTLWAVALVLWWLDETRSAYLVALAAMGGTLLVVTDAAWRCWRRPKWEET